MTGIRHRRGFTTWCAALAALLTSFAAHDTAAQTGTAQNLPALAVDLAQTSVSGISSGAYMAGQFQLAHADIVIGAGIVAGGPYGCAESLAGAFSLGFARVNANAGRAALGCMLNTMAIYGVPNAGQLARRAKRRSARGEIGPMDAILNDRVLLFTGTNDSIVLPAIVRSAARFYQELGLDETHVKLIDTTPAGHGFVSNRSEQECGRNGSPYLVNCDRDLAGEILQHIYGQLAPPGDISLGRFISFDQSLFVDALSRHSMDRTGRAFVPNDCRSGGTNESPPCRVHVAYHGCNQGREVVGDRFVGRSGFARWASTNRLVVLFPQVKKSALNLQGCWDWWGFTSRRFLTKDAPQIKAVRAMLARLAETPN